MFNRQRLGKVKYERRVTWFYFSTAPLLFTLFALLTFNYASPLECYKSISFDLSALLFVITFSRFFICSLHFKQVQAYEAGISLSDVVCMRSGGAGKGKSSAQVYECVVIAQKLWADLQQKYIFYREQVSRWRGEGNVKMLKRWIEARFAYDYYSRNIDTHIPCLWSTVRLELDGRISYDLSLEHMMQRRRLPGFSVLCHDDAGASLPAMLSKTEDLPPELKRFFRYIRHFGFMLRTNDQRATNLVIDLRSVVSKIYEMQEMDAVCRAWFLIWLRAKLQPRVLRLLGDVTNKHARFIRFVARLDELIGIIGFWRYKITVSSGTETTAAMEKEKVRYYIPLGFNCNYDTRSYMLCYEALEQPLIPPQYNMELYVNPAAYAADNALVTELYEKKQAGSKQPAADAAAASAVPAGETAAGLRASRSSRAAERNAALAAAVAEAVQAAAKTPNGKTTKNETSPPMSSAQLP